MDDHFWYVPTVGGCGPAFNTLEQAVAAARAMAQGQDEIDDVYGRLQDRLYGLPEYRAD